MAVENLTSEIITRLQKIIESRFKNQLKVYNYDAFDVKMKQISIIDAGRVNQSNWAPSIAVDKFYCTLTLRHLWQKDQNKRNNILEDVHRLRTVILDNRSDSSTGWYNGYIDSDDSIVNELGVDSKGEEYERFWKIDNNFSCIIAHDFTETQNNYLMTENEELILTEEGEVIEYE